MARQLAGCCHDALDEVIRDLKKHLWGDIKKKKKKGVGVLEQQKQDASGICDTLK